MAENLNKVNTRLIYIFLFFNTFTCVKSRDEVVPVLIWTSSDFQNGKNVEYSAFDKIESDKFESYVSGLLGDKKPAIVVFLEQVLDTVDFDWKDEDGNNSFQFLTEFTIASKLNYFREVEAPHQTLAELSKKGYAWKHIKSDQDIEAKEGDLLLMEFRKIDENRPETLKSHDKTMEKITRHLIDSGESWICVYTARRSNSKGLSSDKKLSSWYVDDEQPVKRPVKAVSLYHDEHTGFALITKGFIELHLPSVKNTISKPLDDYLRASATSLHKKIIFVIWFSNYKLSFYLNREIHDWVIKEAKIENDNGDTLNLERQEETFNKCYNHVVEFKSKEEPIVKVILHKYKFLKLPQHESCVKPYGVELLAVFIFFLVVFIVVFWNSVLESYDFSPEAELSSDKILTFNFETSIL